jgi:ADP-ribosylglycohydrolase
MRVAPVGLFCARDPGASPERATRRAFDLGCEMAGLTHGHPTGQVAAGAFAALVAQLVHGASLPAAIAVVRPLVERRPLGAETLRAIDKAVALAGQGPAAPDRVAALGEGWVADEALAIALYAALAADSFETGVLAAINHDGDSDSTGAIAGNLLGALHGIDQVPRRWLSQLELGELVAAIADDLATWPDWPVGEFVAAVEATDYWLRRYPPA